MANKRDARREIHGYVPAVVSPFNAAGELMVDHFAEVVGWHLDRGADGICVAGDNGEAWALTPDDRRRLARTATEVVAGRVHVTMGASAPTARQTIENAAIAAEAGVDSLMITPQSYVLKATRSEIVGRYKTVHKAVPLPILLYNSPRRTGGVNMDVDVLGALSDALPVIGLKESSRDFFHLSHVIRRLGRRISILVGPAHYVFPGLALGAAGFLATGAEFLGDSVRRVRPLAAARPGPEARDMHHSLTVVYETLMGTGTWPAALKAGLNMIGVPAGVPREPVEPLSPKDSRKLQTVLDDLGLLTGTRPAATGVSRRHG